VLPDRPSQRIQIAAVRFALAVEQLRHVCPRFLAGDALVQPSVELSFDETVIDIGGSNLTPDMRVSRRVRVDVFELLVDADDGRGFVQPVQERLPTLVFGVVVPGVEE
jgi:hypothetical protein